MNLACQYGTLGIVKLLLDLTNDDLIHTRVRPPLRLLSPSGNTNPLDGEQRRP